MADLETEKIAIRKKVVRDGEHWLWTGPRNFGRGEPRLSPGRYVRNVMWEAVNGAVPEGMRVSHTCDQETCVAIAHLELVPLTAPRPRTAPAPQVDALDLEARVAELERQVRELTLWKGIAG